MSDLAGRISAGVHRLQVRVYYEDTDFTGVVYHANYLKYCERGRSDYLRLLGIHHGELSATGLAFVVRRMALEFLAPARIDDELTVETRFGSHSGARIEVSQSVVRGRDVLLTAAATIAVVGPGGRPQRIPAAMAVLLARSLLT